MATERQYVLTTLIVCYRLNIDNATIVLAFRFAFVQHFCSNVDCITNKHGVQVFDALIVEVGNGLSANVRYCNTYGKGENQRTNHENLTVLVMTCIVCIRMNRMVVHCHQTKEIVITLEDGFGKRVFYLAAHFELFKI